MTVKIYEFKMGCKNSLKLEWQNMGEVASSYFPLKKVIM